jgi:hypothetical protein
LARPSSAMIPNADLPLHALLKSSCANSVKPTRRLSEESPPWRGALDHLLTAVISTFQWRWVIGRHGAGTTAKKQPRVEEMARRLMPTLYICSRHRIPRSRRRILLILVSRRAVSTHPRCIASPRAESVKRLSLSVSDGRDGCCKPHAPLARGRALFRSLRLLVRHGCCFDSPVWPFLDLCDDCSGGWQGCRHGRLNHQLLRPKQAIASRASRLQAREPDRPGFFCLLLVRRTSLLSLLIRRLRQARFWTRDAIGDVPRSTLLAQMACFAAGRTNSGDVSGRVSPIVRRCD